MEKHRKDKMSWMMKPLCAGLLLIACILAASSGTYARYTAVYHASSDINLTVKPGTYTVVLHYGEDAAGDTVTYEFTYKMGEQVTIPKVGDFYTKTGYTGKGWTTGSGGDERSFEEGSVAANLTGGGRTLHLYPKWSLNSYKVTYDAAGGTDAPAEETAYYGTVHTLSTKAPTRKDYIFKGWFSQKDAGEKLEMIEITGDITVFAHWKPDTVKVTYMPNLLPRGYTQVKWIRGDGSSYIDTGLVLDSDYQMRVVYESTDTSAAGQSAWIIGAGGNMGYYAAVKANKLMLGWGWPEASDGTSGSESADTGNTAAYTVSPKLFSDGTGASGKHELYANRQVWRVDGEEVAAFAYEEFKTSGTARVFGASDMQKYFKGRIYEAQFMNRSGLVSSLVPAVSGAGEPGLYDIKRGSFYSNAGTGEFAVGPKIAGESRTVPNDSVIQAEGELFENSGYRLLRWDTKPDGSGQSYRLGDDIAIEDNLILYAIWEEKIPVLKAGGSWYDSVKGGSEDSYTEIRIVDRIPEETAASADAFWYADDEDAGQISCYKAGTTLWIAGNGSGSIRMAADSEGMFSGFSCVTRITGLDLLDSGSCESLAWLFTVPSSQSQDAGSGTAVSGTTESPFSADPDSIQISGATSLTSLRGLAAWDVSKVKNMEGLCCGLAELEELDLDHWDTGAATTLRGAFYGCTKLKKPKICSWDTSAVTDLSYVFGSMGCEAGEAFVMDLTGWCVDEAADVTAMFSGCSKIRSIYVSDIWAVGVSAADEDMFSGCVELAGGAGTVYDSAHVDSGYAHVDSADAPGYLTLATVKAIAAGDTLVFTYGGGEYAVGGLYAATAIDAMYDVPVNAQSESSLGWLSSENDVTRVRIEKNFGRFKPSSMMYWFKELQDVVVFDGIGNMNTSEVTSMKRTFYSAAYNAKVFDIDISSWDVSKVTNFSEMFYQAGYKSGKWSVGDLGRWNTSSATDMSKMFYFSGYGASSWDVGDIGRWDVSHVKSFMSMFASICMHTDTWMFDLSDWNTSSATDMSSMFCFTARKATEWSVGDLKNWDTSKVTRLNLMFRSAGSGAKIWSVGDISGWNTAKVTTMNGVFYGAGTNSEEFVLDVSGWNTGKAITMSEMFREAGAAAEKFSFGGVADWNVSTATNMAGMFKGFGANAAELVLDLRGWKPSKVTRTASMFEGMTSLKTIYVGDGWTTANVPAPSASAAASENMFYNCTSLVGGNGTAYDSEHTDVEYARVDTAENPGYLTAAPTESALLSLASAESVQAAAENVQSYVEDVQVVEESLQVASGSVKTASGSLQALEGSGDIQQKYLETLLRYESSLYDSASGAFTPGTSPVTGTYYAAKEEWMESDEYASWDAECVYLKSLIEGVS